MGMTITEKILAAHAKKAVVKPGDLIMAKTDIVLSNDITGPVAIREFEKFGIEKVYDPAQVAMVPDHFSPAKDIQSAELAKTLRNFAKEQGIHHYFEMGKMGIEHCLLPEQGVVKPGQLIIGADSHTVTYGAMGAFSSGVGSTDIAVAMATGEVWLRVPESIKVVLTGKPAEHVVGKDVILYLIGQIGVDGARYKTLEFVGEGLQYLSMDSRFTICNMAIEAGGKSGIIGIDEQTIAYLKETGNEGYTIYESDADAVYSEVIEIDLGAIKPQIAKPHLPSNTVAVDEIESTKIDQVVIGSCTNGRMEDMHAAADILRGKRVHEDIRLIVIPGTQQIYKECMQNGVFEAIIDAGGVVSTPTCGPCLGGHMGILAKGERALSTTNRNFVGRMGHPESEVYLCNPAVAAASAITGYITSPEEVK
ncbi:MAG: 3-isopropylmalate dehydratase large subunit [Clostridia bacterium]|nr:3-isopropylmalate dehydratase large subunit [Clostridia bacterium]